MLKYTLFVDESGDLGLDKVRTDHTDRGASPFLVFGAALIPDSEHERFRTIHESLRSEFGIKKLHCSELNHLQVAKICRTISLERNILLFALISKKETLGSYKNFLSGDTRDQDYYNKCVSYLLERVGNFMEIHNIPSSQLSVVFEERAHDYQKIRAFIRQIRATPFDERAGRFLSRIDPLSITAQKKEANTLLSFADTVAYGVHQAVNASSHNYGIPDQRYLRELKGKFFCDPKTKVIGDWGLKFFKRHAMRMDKGTRQFVDKLHKPLGHSERPI